MQRYTMEAVSFYGYAPHVEADTCDGGDWVKADEAQAEIDRLTAEVERLRYECKRKGYEIEMHSSLAEHARQQRDTAHNDAIEAAAALVEPWKHPEDIKREIRALRRERVE